MKIVEEYTKHMEAANEHIWAVIDILEAEGIESDLRSKRVYLYDEFVRMRYPLIEKQISLKRWLKGVLGFGK